MWYLLVWISSAIAVIPEKYPTEEACHAAAKSDKWPHSCIKAPVLPASNINLENPGYYCGQYPEKCKIDNMPKCIMSVTGLECK